MNINVNTNYTLDILNEIVSIPSPTGYTKNVIAMIEAMVAEMGYPTEKTNKGNLIITVDGENNDYCIGIPVHVDTLGAMVRSINTDGTLRITTLGGNMFNTLDGEYVTIYTRDNRRFAGTMISTSPAAHVFPDAKTKERSEENMCVRIDEIVRNADDVKKLGIGTGDFVAVDPKFMVTESGFIKSRYLDDKAGTSCALTLLKILKDEAKKPKNKLKIMISTYEEVGHGCSYVPDDIDEMVGIDMGCIGLDLSCTETEVSICAKDSSGPYDFDIVNKLIRLAKENNLGYAVDVYPSYSSDVSAALKGGKNVRGGLIGPGVAASHGMERTHVKGIENTIKLIYAYVME